MEKISWTNGLKNEKVIDRVKKKIVVLPTIKHRKSDWIFHTWCRNCFLWHVIEGEIKGWEDEEEDLRCY
jgi:hypothetical protein